MKKIDPHRVDLAREFKHLPLGPHGDELQKVLNIMRWGDTNSHKVIVRDSEQWAIGEISKNRLAPIKIDTSPRFDDLGDAFWHIFRLRWKAHTGDFPNID